MNHKIILSIIFLVQVISGNLLYAEKSKKLKTLTLSEAIHMAMKNNLDYKIAYNKQKISREKVNEVWGKLLPIIESEASVVRQGADKGFISLSDGQYDIKIVQMSFGINPGAFYHSLQMSRKNYKIARQEVRRIKSEIENNIIQSYFTLLMAEEVIQLKKESIALLKENLKDVRQLHRTGSVPRYELLQAQVKLKSMEPQLLEAENIYRNALDMFHYQLGLDDRMYTVDRTILKKKKYQISNEEIDDFMIRIGNSAMINRPEMIQLKLKKQAAKNAKNMYSSYYIWPTFSIGAYYGYNKNEPNPISGTPIDLSRITGDNKWQPNWQVRIAATYRWSSLLPIDSSQASKRKAKALEKEAEHELLKLKRLIAISVKSAYSNLVTAHHLIISHRENVARAEEGLRIARASYRAGVIKNSELFAAQLSVTEAKTGYIEAVNKYYTSLSRLQKELGVNDTTLIFKGDTNE